MTKKIISISAAIAVVVALGLAGLNAKGKDKDKDKHKKGGKDTCQCKKELKPELKACLKGVKDNKDKKGKKTNFNKQQKKGVIKECLADYKAAVKECRTTCNASGGQDSQICIDACTTAQADAVAECEVTFNPNNCGPRDTACQAEQPELLSACIAEAETVGNSCKASCQ